jgi:flagellar L-ring protein precursor FlgH
MMIGNRDYRVIVTGIVRAEDFSEDGVSATKLLDPKFDVVSARQKDDFL